MISDNDAQENFIKTILKMFLLFYIRSVYDFSFYA